MPWVFLLALPALLLALILITRDRARAAFRWVDAAAVLGLALAAAGFFWRVVARPELDAGRRRRPGLLPLPHLSLRRRRACTPAPGRSGTRIFTPARPHVADIQAGFLYPPNLLLFLLWPDFPYAALQWLSMAHIWFAGAGMYLLLRAVGAGCGVAPPWPARSPSCFPMPS